MNCDRGDRRPCDDRHQILGGGPGEQQREEIYTAAIAYGAASPLVIVAKLNDRYFLMNGYHRARGLLTLTRQRPPVDIETIIDLAGVPVVERVLLDGIRGTIGDVAGQRSIILNRHHRFSSEQEGRWVLAEELGHVLLGHQLVESPHPGKSTIGLLEERRILYEREARAFAAELLMPFFEVRRRWFAISQERPVEGELSLEDRVKRLAEELA